MTTSPTPIGNLVPPIPDRRKLAVTWLGARFPFLVPWLARGYAAVTGKPVSPPFLPPNKREILQRTLFRQLGNFLNVDRFQQRVKREPSYAGLNTELSGSLVDTLRPTHPEQRSIVFLHNSYYHFYYLAAALRRRGWHALSVSFESPESANQLYYHGEDLDLWHADAGVRLARMWDFFEAVAQNFRMLHWHASTNSGIFDANFQNLEHDVVPWDYLELRRRGVKLGFSISGCLTGQTQTAIHKATGGLCDKCPWQLEPIICSDGKNRAAGLMLSWLCDLIAVEIDWPLEFRQRPNAFREPLTYCVDADLWRPDLEVPPDKRLEREPGEILIYHAMGNYDIRSVNGRNIKGTGAVIKAVDRLRMEGIPARLVFKTNVRSRDMRFYQVQADIVVDQLNYGRYGATARECMMLGRPTICYLDRNQPPGVNPSPSLQECPLVSANEETVYEALRELCLSPDLRYRIGAESRRFALKWHSAEACAARFERVYDRIMAGQLIETADVYN